MKKTLSILAVTLLLAGCFKDDRNNFMVPDGFGISATNILQDASVHTGKYKLGINKSGKGQSSGTVSIKLDNEALAEYNEANGTDYKAVLPSLVSFDKQTISYDVTDAAKILTISWDPEIMAQFISMNTKYVIPIHIESQDLKVNEGRDLVLIHMTRSAVSVPQTGVSRVLEGNVPIAEEDLHEDLILDVTLSPAVKSLGISFPVCIDNSLIESYNQAHETSFTEAPEGLVELTDEKAVIKEGALGGSFRIKLNKSVLCQGGVPVEFPDYLIPVRLQKENLEATMGGEEFTLKGISYGNMVTYISFTYYAPPAGLSIMRKWGKYSLENASWNSYFGGVADADRNFTMDDTYIYVPETSLTDATIWRIDIQHPENVSKVAAPSNPTGYFKQTAVRMMDPGTTNMNGGKPMLIASNMVMTDGGDMLKLYIYDKGTDTAPSEWIMDETNLGRRLGDIFTTHGTFKDGGFFFKDWN